MTTSPDQRQPAQQPYAQMPPIIINNTSSASAAATAMVGAVGLRRRRQSFWVHFWLFCLTAGIGNVFYAMYISRWNRDRGL